MNMEHQQNHNWQGKTKELEKKPDTLQFAYFKSHICRSGSGASLDMRVLPGVWLGQSTVCQVVLTTISALNGQRIPAKQAY
jgi:hypothetical protein